MTTDAAPSPDLLKKLGIQTHEQVQDSQFARVLVLGAPKIGKTTALVSTAQAPLILNCDGNDATKYARKHCGSTALEFPITTRAAWRKGIDAAFELARQGGCRSIILDSISLFADALVSELSVTMTGHDLWREVLKDLTNGVRRLCMAQAHVFVVAHFKPPEDADQAAAAGILPMVPGQAKTKIPAMLTDWVVFEALPAKPPSTEVTRQFLVGPQKFWAAAGRNAHRSAAVAPTVPALFAELGLTL